MTRSFYSDVPCRLPTPPGETELFSFWTQPYTYMSVLNVCKFQSFMKLQDVLGCVGSVFIALSSIMVKVPFT